MRHWDNSALGLQECLPAQGNGFHGSGTSAFPEWFHPNQPMIFVRQPEYTFAFYSLVVGHFMFSRLYLSCAAAPCSCGWRSCDPNLPICLAVFLQCSSYSLSRMILIVLTEPSSLPQKALGAGLGHCGRDGGVGSRRDSCTLEHFCIKNLVEALYLTFIFLLFVLGSGFRLSMKLELDLLATLLKQKPGHYHLYLHGWSVLQQGLRAWSWSGETAAPSFTLLMTWSISCR